MESSGHVWVWVWCVCVVYGCECVVYVVVCVCVVCVVWYVWCGMSVCVCVYGCMVCVHVCVHGSRVLMPCSRLKPWREGKPLPLETLACCVASGATLWVSVSPLFRGGQNGLVEFSPACLGPSPGPHKGRRKDLAIATTQARGASGAGDALGLRHACLGAVCPSPGPLPPARL